MDQEQLTAIFDKQAAGYDRQWDSIAPIRDSLYLVTETAVAAMPADARVLAVGVGTGAELAHLAARFSGWRFTAVDPSAAMIDECRKRAEADGFADRCIFHHGFLDSLPATDPFDVATSFLVSQFILDRDERTAYFTEIASRLRPGGVLVSSDLSAENDPVEFDELVRIWMFLMSGPDVSEERLAGARATYRSDVGVLPPDEIATIIQSAGFAAPIPIYRVGLLHAWSSTRLVRPRLRGSRSQIRELASEVFNGASRASTKGRKAMESTTPIGAWVGDIEKETLENTNFRTTLFTGTHTQLTVMSLKPGEEIGWESHGHLDQFLRIEQGTGRADLGPDADTVSEQHDLSDDWVVIIPAGTWHNVTNTGDVDLKIYSLYSPPEHPAATVHVTKAEADAAEAEHDH